MTLIDKSFYLETRKIALGEIQPSPLLTELSDFFEKTYSVKILNFEFTRFHIPNSNRHKLYITIQNTDDYKKMYKSIMKPIEEYQKQIGLEFQKLALKHQFAKEEELEDIWVVYNDFSEEAKTDTRIGEPKKSSQTM